MATHFIITCDRCLIGHRREASHGSHLPPDWAVITYDSETKTAGACDRIEVCHRCLMDWHEWRRGKAVPATEPA